MQSATTRATPIDLRCGGRAPKVDATPSRRPAGGPLSGDRLEADPTRGMPANREVSFHLCWLAEYPVTVDFVRPIEAIVPGAQGHVLAVLAETMAQVSQLGRSRSFAGESRRRRCPGWFRPGSSSGAEVPPASLFRLVRQHVASRALLALARCTDPVLDEIGRLAASLHPPVASSSSARSLAARRNRTATSTSWWSAPPTLTRTTTTGPPIEDWRSDVRRLTGNPVDVLEVSADARRHGSRAAASCGRRSVETVGSSTASVSTASELFECLGPEGRSRCLPRSAPTRQGRGVRRGRRQRPGGGPKHRRDEPCLHAGSTPPTPWRPARRRAGRRGPDQVLVLLRQGRPDSAEVERDLRRLLPLKTKAEYDPDDIAPTVAAKAVERPLRRRGPTGGVHGARGTITRSVVGMAAAPAPSRCQPAPGKPGHDHGLRHHGRSRDPPIAAAPGADGKVQLIRYLESARATATSRRPSTPRCPTAPWWWPSGDPTQRRGGATSADPPRRPAHPRNLAPRHRPCPLAPRRSRRRRRRPRRLLDQVRAPPGADPDTDPLTVLNHLDEATTPGER